MENNIYLIYGNEEFIAQQKENNIKHKILKKFPNIDICKLSAANYKAEILTEVMQPSLFSKEKLIIIHHCDKKNDLLLKDIKVFLKEEYKYIFIIFRCLEENKSILNLLKKTAKVLYVNSLKNDSDCIKYLNEIFINNNQIVENNVLRYLINYTGKKSSELNAAATQLVNDSVGKITVELIQKYYHKKVYTNAFTIVNALVLGNTELAIREFRERLGAGNIDITHILASIASIFRLMAKISDKSAIPLDILSKELKVNPWQIKQARNNLKRWNIDSLLQVMKLIAKTDFDIKGGSSYPIYSFEEMLFKISRINNSKK